VRAISKGMDIRISWVFLFSFYTSDWIDMGCRFLQDFDLISLSYDVCHSHESHSVTA